MRKSILTLALFAGAAFAMPAAAASTTFVGVSSGVVDPETGAAEQYTVRFTFDDSPSPYPDFERVTVNPPFVPYRYAYYINITSISVVGQRFDVSFDYGFSGVSTLDSSRARDGNVGIQVFSGSDSTTVGYSVGFMYQPQGAYATTAMPTSLDISAAFENGFNLTEYYYEGDPADEYILSRELLNFRFASGGFLPAATAVPEPAGWATMLVGFGAVGYGLRRRRPGVVAA